MNELVLVGINGGNPLGFMAALGAILLMRGEFPAVRLSWRIEHGTWRPVVHECLADEEKFSKMLSDAFKRTSSEPFEVDGKLPFEVGAFASKLKSAQAQASPADRRMVDFLAAYGTEIHHDKGNFLDTSLRMMRSGDASGQGLPAYALTIRRTVDEDALRRTLFGNWDYQDDSPIMRWDPVEDQRYALVWNAPQDTAKKQVKFMLGANALALEAMVFFPVMPGRTSASTTGFYRPGKQEYFIWPIWTHPVSLDVVRSLLSLRALRQYPPDRGALALRGIAEIYRSQRIASSKYYKNFTPAEPV